MMMTERLFHQLLFLIVYADNLVHERELFLAKNLSLMAGFRSDLPAYFNQLTEQDRYQLLRVQRQLVAEMKAKQLYLAA